MTIGQYFKSRWSCVHRARAILFAVVGLLVCGFHIDVSASEPAPDDSFTKQELIEHFVGTAFGAEYSDSDSETSGTMTLKRWDEPLRVIRITSEENDVVLTAQLNEIALLTGITWDFVGPPNPENFNYLVVIADRTILKEVLDRLAK